jgi:hypothetical protein
MHRKRNYFLALFLWSIFYIVGTVAAPLSPNRFNITPSKTHFLQITIALPVVVIWFIALSGAARFKEYANSINKYKDGKAMDEFANGLLLLVFSVISSGLSAILRPWAIKDGWLQGFTIVFNLVQVILALVAFFVMFRGSEKLLRVISKKRRNVLRDWLPVILAMILISAIYISVLFNYQYRNSTPDPLKFSSYYMSDVVLLLTIVIPTIIGWALGLKAARNMIIYRREIKGNIYQGALFRTALGVAIVVCTAVIFQLLSGLAAYLSKAGLQAILLIVYALILLYSIGFVVIASGTKKLCAIENAGVNK